MKPHQGRILFLKEFTRHLILNSRKEGEKIEEKKELEKEISEEPHIPSLLKPQPSPPQPPQKMKLPPRHPRPALRLIKPLIRGYRPSIMPKTPAIKPVPTQPAKPLSFGLGKLELLIKDPRVTLIECPGPGKFVLARTSGQTTITKITLTQEEIQEIIEKFSKEARIPILPGLFKAAVGNLIITAVISNTIGTRFIITKITPMTILEQQGKL